MVLRYTMGVPSKKAFVAKAKGSVRSSDLNVRGASVTCSSGGGMTMTKAKGLGRCMVADLDSAIRTAKLQYKEDRIAAARDRLVGRLDHHPLAVRF